MTNDEWAIEPHALLWEANAEMAIPACAMPQTTTDHDQIRRWAEERQGTPATVIRTTRPGQESSILRIDFPGFSDKGTLKLIPWVEWFRQFDERNLAFLYQDRAANGQLSRFFKLISRPEKSE